jgi:hypothetical protein
MSAVWVDDRTDGCELPDLWHRRRAGGTGRRRPPPPRPAPPASDPWAIPKPGEQWGVPGHQSPPAWQQPAQPYGYVPQRRTRSAGAGYSIAGIICGAIALFFCPIVFGIAGLVLSGKAKSRGEPLAGVARIVSIVGLIGGFVIGILVYTQM